MRIISLERCPYKFSQLASNFRSWHQIFAAGITIKHAKSHTDSIDHYFWVKNPRKVRNFLCTEEVGELVVAAEKKSFSTLIVQGRDCCSFQYISWLCISC